MKNKRFIPLVLLMSCIQLCYAGHIEKLKDGLLIKLDRPAAGGAKQVKLQVISDKIIRVTASANDSISATPSLIAIASANPDVKWTSSEKDNKVILKTAVLTVSVDMGTGEVLFMDMAGNVILQEKK